MPAMCAGSAGGGSAASGYPEAFQSSSPTSFDEEVKVLQQQNHRLRQQQLSLERAALRAGAIAEAAA